MQRISNSQQATFIKYVISRLNFEVTPGFQPKPEICLTPHFNSYYRLLDGDQLELILQISITHTEDEPKPFSVFGEIHGLFSMSGINENLRMDFIKVNAMAMLFPYLRSAITNISSTCGVPPVVLPIIDVRILTSGIQKID